MAVEPKRLYFETYLQLIKNSVGSGMFRNFYIEDALKGKFDALDDGSNSCAFYVSSLLVMLGKIKSIHGLISSTLKDLEESGWRQVSEVQPGDVIVWETMDFDDGPHAHIGFAANNGKAVSTSRAEKKVVEHDIHFGGLNRPIKQVYRFTQWD